MPHARRQNCITLPLRDWQTEARARAARKKRHCRCGHGKKQPQRSVTASCGQPLDGHGTQAPLRRSFSAGAHIFRRATPVQGAGSAARTPTPGPLRAAHAGSVFQAATASEMAHVDCSLRNNLAGLCLSCAALCCQLPKLLAWIDTPQLCWGRSPELRYRRPATRCLLRLRTQLPDSSQTTASSTLNHAAASPSRTDARARHRQPRGLCLTDARVRHHQPRCSRALRRRAVPRPRCTNDRATSADQSVAQSVRQLQPWPGNCLGCASDAGHLAPKRVIHALIENVGPKPLLLRPTAGAVGPKVIAREHQRNATEKNIVAALVALALA